MIEIKIPQEINKYEAKLVGPLTTRQTICLVGMAVVCIATFNILKSLLPEDYLYIVCLFLAVPFALCGWYRPYGMHFEKFFMAVLFNTIISSSRRIFKSSNIVENIEKKLITPSVEEMNSKKKQKKQKTVKQKDPKKIQKKYKKHTML